MNITFSLANVLTALTIMGGMLVVTHQVSHHVGKWTQSVDSMLRELKDFQKSQALEILSLRKSRHEHGEDILLLKAGLEGVQNDVGDMMHRRGLFCVAVSRVRR